MIPKGLFTQIGMMIVSVAIIFTYIKPEFAKIQVIQDDIKAYQDQRKMVVSVNSLLDSLKSRVDSVSSTDTQKLFDYMPDVVDNLSVPRDLYLISAEAGVIYIDSKYNGNDIDLANSADSQDEAAAGVDNKPQPHSLTLGVEGSYKQIKNLVSLLEKNHYPLEVRAMNISSLEGGFLKAEIDLSTYSYGKFVAEEEIIF